MTSDSIKALTERFLGSDMLKTIACESGYRQFDENGRVLRSKTDDVGIAQINVETWGEKAMELGFDIYTPLGNLRMAQHILKVQGRNAWVCHKLLSGDS